MSTVTNEFSSDFLRKNLPFFDEIRKISLTLPSTAYIVGGSVRDMIMGKDVADVDIVPFGIDYEVFAKTLAKSLKAPAVPFKDNMRLMKHGFVIDVSKPRGQSIEKDLSLRDFTINNLACDMDGKIIGDKSDIENKIIRSAYKETFDDDPLRILRAFRFKSFLGFDIDKNTLNLIAEKKNLASTPAYERIVEEMKKTFDGAYFEKLFEDNLFTQIMKIISGTSAINPRNVLRLKHFACGGEDIFPIFLALLFEDTKAEIFFKNLPLSSKDAKLISNILRAEKNIDFEALKNEKRLEETAWRFYNILKSLTIFLKSKYPSQSDIIQSLEKIGNSIDPSKALAIGGEDLKKMGFKPSPLFSTILDDVKEKLALERIDPKDIKKYIENRYNLTGKI